MDELNNSAPPPEDEAADEDDAILALARLFFGISPSQLSGNADSEAEPADDDVDIATDQSDPVFVLDRPVGARRAPREIAPTSRPWVNPWTAALRESEQRFEAQSEALSEQRYERTRAVTGLLDEYDQSRAAGAEPPESWRHLWWWAEVFGVADELEAEVADRRRTVWIEQPSEELEAVSGEHRIYAGALLTQLPVPPATEAVPRDALPREYVAALDFAVGLQPSLTISDVDEWLVEHLGQFEYEPVALATPARSLRRRRRRFRDDEDESGPVEVNPPRFRLDDGTDGSDDEDRDIATDQSDPVWVIVGPKPPTFDGHSSRAPYKPPAEPAAPHVPSHKDQLGDLDTLEPDMSVPGTIDSAVDDAARPDTALAEPSDYNPPGSPPPEDPDRDSAVDESDPVTIFDRSKPGAFDDAAEDPDRDSAVDQSDPVTIFDRSKPGAFDDPAEDPDGDSAVDESDPVTIFDRSSAAHADAAVEDVRTGGAGRAIRLGAIAAAVAAVAVIALLALSGGDDESEGDAAVGVGGGAVTATAEATVTADPASDATEQPSFTITKPPRLIICGNGSSFSGIEQPDGTFLDELTGERRSCLD